ncbi:MAG TPA: Mbeg1-like protein, partial [Paenibacillus sp.]
MSELSDRQLILLDNLIYLDDVANRNNKKVEDIVDDLLKGGLDKSRTVKDGIVSYPGLMTREEWVTILEAIRNDPQLTKLTLKHGDIGNVYDKNGNIIVDQNGKSLEVGARMATFVDSDKNATVVFRGTAGDYEWYDNGTGGYLSDTDMQKQALKYVESLPYTNITVTGHSKGGNKAQYVGILSDKVARVLSLDGQGFSKEFVEQYQDLINKNTHKITSISAENDYVNCLLIPVAGKFIYIDTEYQQNFLRNHSPVIVLDENGQLRVIAEQGAIPRLVNDLTIYLNAHMKEPDRSYVMDGLLALLQHGDEGFQIVSESQTNESIKIVLPYVADYLMEKAAQGGKDFGNLLAATIGMAVMPQEFMDDFLRYLKINADNFSYLSQLKKEIFAILGPIIREKLQAFVSDLGDNIANKAEKIAASISEFASKIKDRWDAMVGIINNFMSDLKNEGIATLEKINQFKNKIFQGVQDFGNWVAEGTQKAADAVKNTWNSSVDTVKGWFGVV